MNKHFVDGLMSALTDVLFVAMLSVVFIIIAGGAIALSYGAVLQH